MHVKLAVSMVIHNMTSVAAVLLLSLCLEDCFVRVLLQDSGQVRQHTRMAPKTLR